MPEQPSNALVEALKATLASAAQRPVGPLFAFDTGLLHFLLDESWRVARPEAAARVTGIIAEQGLTIAEITYYELKRSIEHLALNGLKPLYTAQALHLLNNAELLPLTGRLRWDLVARYWADAEQAGYRLGENDLLIALTALFHNRMLLTADRKLDEGLKALRAAQALSGVPRLDWNLTEFVDIGSRPVPPRPSTK